MINIAREYVIELLETQLWQLDRTVVWRRTVLWTGRDRTEAFAVLDRRRKEVGDTQNKHGQTAGKPLSRVVLNVYCDGDERKPYEKETVE